MKKILTLALTFACAAWTAAAQNTAKEAIEFAEGVNFGNFDPAIPITQHSYFEIPEGWTIWSPDGAELSRGGLFLPGSYRASWVWYETVMKAVDTIRTTIYVTPDQEQRRESLLINFEAGKSYAARGSGIAARGFRVVEISDSAVDSMPLKYCHIIPDEGAGVESIVNVYDDGSFSNPRKVNLSAPFIIAAGRYVLHARWHGDVGGWGGDTKTGQTLTDEYEFEEGKYYRLRYEIAKDKKSLLFFIEPTTDAAIITGTKDADKTGLDNLSKLREYLAFQSANPGLLDGAWSSETKRAMTSYSMQFRLTGDKMVFESRSGKREFMVEGTIFYNENTIILIPDKATANGKDVKDFGLKTKIGDLANPSGPAPRYVWYYTLVNGVLTLESNRKPTAGGLMWENDGELRQTAQ